MFPPWNVRDDDYEKLDVSKMDPFIDMVSKVLSSWNIFCSVQQFNDCSKAARTHKSNDPGSRKEI